MLPGGGGGGPRPPCMGFLGGGGAWPRSIGGGGGAVPLLRVPLLLGGPVFAGGGLGNVLFPYAGGGRECGTFCPGGLLKINLKNRLINQFLNIPVFQKYGYTHNVFSKTDFPTLFLFNNVRYI